MENGKFHTDFFSLLFVLFFYAAISVILLACLAFPPRFFTTLPNPLPAFLVCLLLLFLHSTRPNVTRPTQTDKFACLFTGVSLSLITHQIVKLLAHLVAHRYFCVTAFAIPIEFFLQRKNRLRTLVIIQCHTPLHHLYQIV